MKNTLHSLPRSTHKGFTLVELSIVLVILGLLVGGVLAGQALIRISELRAISSEYEKYRTSIGAFKVKYMAIPGDMPNAVQFWGAATGSTADGTDASCMAYTTATSPNTCNGDGDNLVAEDSGTTHELLRAWQHLSNAGMVEGSYTGVPSGGGQEIGVNVPTSKLSGSGWMIQGLGNYSGNAIFFAAKYGNVLNVGPLTGGSVTGQEAFMIDQKMDDGKPNTGRMLAYKHAVAPECVAASNTDYTLDSDVRACLPTLITGF